MKIRLAHKTTTNFHQVRRSRVGFQMVDPEINRKEFEAACDAFLKGRHTYTYQSFHYANFPR